MKPSTWSEVVANASGWLLVDKPLGVTSHDVVDWLRHQIGIGQIGHAGTLDPLASGLLIMLVGQEFTKKQTEFLHLSKKYWWQARLGWESDSYDLEGRLRQTAEWSQLRLLDQEQVTIALASLTGTQHQTVPLFSAVKVAGRKLYTLGRRQRRLSSSTRPTMNQVERIPDKLPVKTVEIFQLTLTKFDQNLDDRQLVIAGELVGSSGIYVRSMVHDLGQILGVGAVTSGLRRLAIGNWSVDQAIKLAKTASGSPTRLRLVE